VQHYLPLEPDLHSHQEKAVAQDVFPRPVKFFLALPMALFLEAGAPIDALAQDLEHFGDEIPGRPPIPEGVLDTFFLDSGGLQSPGGTGRPFDWRKAVPIAEGTRHGGLRLVVAGGLNSENVGEAMGILKPWGVDVLSGVEARPGKKDAEKVRAFVRAVRKMDRKTS
jgi:hypothetical protein